MNAASIQQLQELKRVQQIPNLLAIEGRPFQEISFTWYLQNPTSDSLRFTAELMDGSSLPAGLICEENGVFRGTPNKGTAKKEPYVVLLVAQSDSTWPLVLETTLTIVTQQEAAALKKGEGAAVSVSANEQALKEFWKNFAANKTPNINEVFNRPVTPEEVYFLLERYATLAIWNADDLTYADEGKAVSVEGLSRYQAYDFGSVLIATPKDLYDAERGLGDMIETAKALMQEVYRRGWKIVELTGFDKMQRVAWVESQMINSKVSHDDEKIHVRYEPRASDYRALLNQWPVKAKGAELTQAEELQNI